MGKPADYFYQRGRSRVTAITVIYPRSRTQPTRLALRTSCIVSSTLLRVDLPWPESPFTQRFNSKFRSAFNAVFATELFFFLSRFLKASENVRVKGFVCLCEISELIGAQSAHRHCATGNKRLKRSSLRNRVFPTAYLAFRSND